MGGSQETAGGRATLSRFIRWFGRFSYDAGRPRAPDLLSRNGMWEGKGEGSVALQAIISDIDCLAFQSRLNRKNMLSASPSVASQLQS